MLETGGPTLEGVEEPQGLCVHQVQVQEPHRQEATRRLDLHPCCLYCRRVRSQVFWDASYSRVSFTIPKAFEATMKVVSKKD